MNDICGLCDLDRAICSCVPASPIKPRRRLFPTCPVHYWRDQYDPQDDREIRR